ncbi:alcohol dehydrogenase catalytic domain-containing protein [Nocardia sp. NPDC004860]|uniref:alcohol dehydrogenase catalytic domain-containing protein n=1 Tax=Nocardia sp. NPDC004860 TaxID=3154557 RepID=UPI0033AF0575
MFAVTLDGYGGLEVMKWSQVDDLPAPGPGEVTVDVVAAGVNRADVMQRYGLYPPPPGASDILGLEVSGIVADVGGDVQDWKPGDAVCARRRLWPLISAGTVAPVVSAVVPIHDVSEAHPLLDSADTVGKVLLQVREP